MRSAALSPARAKPRKNCPIALGVLALACAWVLVIVVAPKGTFSPQPGVVQTNR